MNTYGLYDIKDSECLVTFGNIHDIAKFIGTTTGVIRSNMSRKQKLSHRYEIVKLEDEE